MNHILNFALSIPPSNIPFKTFTMPTNIWNEPTLTPEEWIQVSALGHRLFELKDWPPLAKALDKAGKELYPYQKVPGVHHFDSHNN